MHSLVSFEICRDFHNNYIVESNNVVIAFPMLALMSLHAILRIWVRACVCARACDVCICVRACERACMRACMRARVCICANYVAVM